MIAVVMAVVRRMVVLLLLGLLLDLLCLYLCLLCLLLLLLHREQAINDGLLFAHGLFESCRVGRLGGEKRLSRVGPLRHARYRRNGRERERRERHWIR